MKSIVVGSGVIGLTTAIRLQEEGHEVQIFSKNLPEQTVSAVAGAIWMPFHVEPMREVNRWSRISYEKFEKLSADETTGVVMFDFLTLANSDVQPEWLDAMPPGRFRKALPEEFPVGYQFGFLSRVPIVETPIYLQFLQQEFKRNGGRLISKEVENLNKTTLEVDWAINCTGLAAGKLTGDPEVFPSGGSF